MYFYDDLFLFIKVVEVGSFIGTAKLLKIGQSTVSRRMKELEDKLNIILFHQHSKGYKLSDAGKSLYADIKNQRENVDNIINKHIKHRERPHGIIKAALPNVLSYDLIAPYLPDFLEQYPEINLEICFHNTEIDLIRDGFDIAIINHIPSQQTQKIKHIYTSTLCLYCTTQYKETYGIPLTPQELKNHTVMGVMREDYTVPDKTECVHRETGKVVIIDTPRRLAVNNAIIGVQMIHSNKIIIGTLDAINFKDKSNIVRILPDYIIGTVKYYMLKHPYENNFITTLFCDFIENLLKPH